MIYNKVFVFVEVLMEWRLWVLIEVCICSNNNGYYGLLNFFIELRVRYIVK